MKFLWTLDILNVGNSFYVNTSCQEMKQILLLEYSVQFSNTTSVQRTFLFSSVITGGCYGDWSPWLPVGKSVSEIDVKYSIKMILKILYKFLVAYHVLLSSDLLLILNGVTLECPMHVRVGKKTCNRCFIVAPS